MAAALSVVALVTVTLSLAPPSEAERRAASDRRGDCPNGSSMVADFLDVVYVGQQQYERGGVRGRTAPAGTRLGRTLETVRCTYSDDSVPGPGYRPRPGDATYLPVGTQVREVVGFGSFRVAAQHGDELALYELQAPASARTTAQVLPGVRRHVVGLVLSGQEDGEREVGRVTSSERVPALADQLFAAPYRPEAWRRTSSTWDVFLDLVLDDGSRVQRAYDSQHGVVQPGIVVPPRVRDELRRALG